MRHNHNFRGSQRKSRRRDHYPAKQSFVGQVASASAVCFVLIFAAAPRIGQIWSHATASPEEIPEIERSVHYSGCDAVRAAGKAPIYAGQPGYREGMDGDGDGIACEPYRGW